MVMEETVGQNLNRIVRQILRHAKDEEANVASDYIEEYPESSASRLCRDKLCEFIVMAAHCANRAFPESYNHAELAWNILEEMNFQSDANLSQAVNYLRGFCSSGLRSLASNFVEIIGTCYAKTN